MGTPRTTSAPGFDTLAISRNTLAGSIKCSATAGKSKAVTKAPFKQKEWPIVVSEDDAAA